MREELDDGECLADAAAVLAARQRVDPLLLRLAAQPFDLEAVDELRRWIDEIYPLAAPAWVRLLGLPDPDCGQPPAGDQDWTAEAVLHLVVAEPGRGRRYDDPPVHRPDQLPSLSPHTGSAP